MKQTFSRQQVVDIIDDLLQRPDTVSNAMHNENTCYSAEDFLNMAVADLYPNLYKKPSNKDILSERDPETLKLYEGLLPEELFQMLCGERVDLLDMHERVAVFMSECTCNMSYTTYTPDVIRGLINEKQEYDLNSFCKDLADDYSDEEILKEIKDRAQN